ncbi:MAG: hypothetical protein WD035_11945 [Balneolaceae bacterium]
MSEEKFIQLRPEWKAYFWLLFWGILLIPLFGIGFILIWIAYKKRSDQFFEIHDRYIKSTNQGRSGKMDLTDIVSVEVAQRWIDKKLDSGTVELSASSSSISLTGMDKPHELAEMIRHAVQAERERLEHKSTTGTPSPSHDPGSLPKMDYLTGLWQQGLINDEDFNKERKHFEG